MSTIIENIRTNSMGTASFQMKTKSMRKFQKFDVYPKEKEDTDKTIIIQSDTRIGILDLKTGKGEITKSYSGGAYFIHLQMGKLEELEISQGDKLLLQAKIFLTASEKVGGEGMFTDNSGAKNII